MGRVATATDAANLTLGYEYDLADRVTAVKYPDNTRDETTFLNGLPIKFKDRHGRLSYAKYDKLQRVEKTYVQDGQDVNAQVGTTSYGYDKGGNLTLLIDTNNRETRWSFDNRERMSGKLYPDGKTESYTYFKNRLTQTITARGRVINFEYDDAGNQTKVDYPYMPDVVTTYDKLDNVKTVTDGMGIHVFSYDDYGRLIANDGPLAGDIQTYAYDELQRIKTQTIEGGANGGVQSQTYGYDVLGRLASINSNGMMNIGQTTYQYEGNTDRLRLLTHPNNTKSDLRYDGLGRLQHVYNGANGNAAYNRYSSNYDTRDIITNTTSRTGAVPDTVTLYSYDALDQLKQERAIGGAPGAAFTANYSYDPMGNRVQSDRASQNSSSVTASTPNELNQLTSTTTAIAGVPTYSSNLYYDDAGNLSQVNNNTGTHTLYHYDDADRLGRIEQYGAGGQLQTVSEFGYDYASRRALTRETTYSNGQASGSETILRVFDGLDVIQERHSNNYLRAHLVRDGGVSGILSRTNYQGTAFYGYDGNGNVTLLTDASGTDVAHYRYDAFGNTLEAAGPRADENPYRFSTKELHGPSGLYDFGYRFYSPGMGRFINRDPLEEDEFNLWRYAFSNGHTSTSTPALYKICGAPSGRSNPAAARQFSRKLSNCARCNG